FATLAACARGEAVRVSANTLYIRTSAAPVCRGAGTLRVSQEVAAIETIRAGFDRYTITSGGLVSGARAQEEGFIVVLYRDSDSNAQQAISAREILGADWQNKVKQGVSTCFSVG